MSICDNAYADDNREIEIKQEESEEGRMRGRHTDSEGGGDGE